MLSRTKHWHWTNGLVAFSALLAACGGGGAGDPGDAGGSSDAAAANDAAGGDTLTGLSATIGPEGGVLQGETGTPFAGVKLVVPAGALAAATRVTVDLAEDPTPLPDDAVRVGQQFAVGDVGVALAVPAQLTLPVDARARDQFFGAAGDVKVWVRSGDGWALREQSASTEGTVTIDLPAFTTAAAGVKITSLITSRLCGTSTFPSCGTTTTTAPTTTCSSGFCVDTLDTSTAVPASIFALGGTRVFYNTGTGGTAVARLNLGTGSIDRVPTVPGSCFGLASVPLNAVDPAGNLWTHGCKFTFGLRPAAITLPAFPSLPNLAGRIPRAQTALADGSVRVVVGYQSADLTPHGVLFTRAADGTLSAPAVLDGARELGAVQHIAPDPGDPGNVWAVGGIFTAAGDTGAIFNITPAGSISTQFPNPADGVLASNDPDFPGITGRLDVRPARILAVAPVDVVPGPNGGNVLSAERLMSYAVSGTALSGPVEVDLHTVVTPTTSLVDAVQDSAGGIYLLTFGGNLWYMSAAGTVTGIPLPFRAFQIAVASDDALIAMGIPDNTTTRALIRVRRGG